LAIIRHRLARQLCLEGDRAVHSPLFNERPFTFEDRIPPNPFRYE